ncbi:MAG: ACP S-malonyltransferase [Lachnospiraceae bacterium]|nr:ACP S-malonyltransferase [Lachnospiraceae bacterium]
MGKIAFVFPGQGVQTPMMGKDFYDNSDDAKDIYRLASEASGVDVEKLCFTQNEELNITEYTQIALLTTEIAMLNEVMKRGIRPDVCAGLSLGEYAALAASGAMELKDIFELIRLRGKCMQEAYPTGGAMMAVLGLDPETVESICDETKGIVYVANDNCPGQIVISGEEEAVLTAGERLSEAGAKRVIRLNVSGPFHSKLLLSASDKLADALEGKTVNEIKIPYVSNTLAEPVTDKNVIKDLLVRQVSSTVRFRESILKMCQMGVDTFVEIGPGKTVAGFIKKTDKDLKVINIEKYDDLEKLNELM